MVKKLWKEFKEFINKGSVMDLAVGMIIGSSFTAIVTALVNNIFKPLINWIPGTDNTGALQSVLRPAVTDANGNIVTEALILDWGAVLSAIITFFITAVILFAIVKVFNRIKKTGELVEGKMKTEIGALVEKVKKDNGKTDNQESEPDAEPQKMAPEKAEETKPETAEELLRQIRDLLQQK